MTLRIDRRAFSLLGLGAGFGAVLPPLRALAADAYPSRPLHLMVGFTPGSSSDITGRVFASGASQILGQNVVVENKPGAGGSIAAGLGARATADGYTLYLQALSTLTYKVTHPEAPFDLATDFAPVALLATGAIVMVVDPKIGVNSVAEFTALAKSKPGQILFGSVGPGSLPDLCGELYAQRAGVKLVQVPYPGSPQVIMDLIAGRVAMNFAIASSVLGQIASGPSQTPRHCRGQALGPPSRRAHHGRSRHPRFQHAAVVRPARAQGHATAGNRQARRRGTQGHARAGGHGRAAQTGFCAGRYGTGSVRRFHQERNRALVAGRAGGRAGEGVIV